MSVIRIAIVKYGQTVQVFVYFYKIEYGMALRILNLELHQHCMIGSKVTTIFVSKLNIYIFCYATLGSNQLDHHLALL